MDDSSVHCHGLRSTGSKPTSSSNVLLEYYSLTPALRVKTSAVLLAAYRNFTLFMHRGIHLARRHVVRVRRQARHTHDLRTRAAPGRAVCELGFYLVHVVARRCAHLHGDLGRRGDVKLGLAVRWDPVPLFVGRKA